MRLGRRIQAYRDVFTACLKAMCILYFQPSSITFQSFTKHLKQVSIYSRLRGNDNETEISYSNLFARQFIKTPFQ